MITEEEKSRLNAFFGYDEREESDYQYLKDVVQPQCLKIESDFWKQDRLKDKPRFHYKDNVWIIRNNDNSVEIIKVRQTHKYAPGIRRGLMDKWEVVSEFTFDANSWKSIVSFAPPNETYS